MTAATPWGRALRQGPRDSDHRWITELVMRRYERASTILTSNRPVEDWGKLLGDNAAVSAMLDRLLHHAHVLKCGPRSYRTHRAGLSADAGHE
jgi:DNA replication protein DnaC